MHCKNVGIFYFVRKMSLLELVLEIFAYKPCRYYTIIYTDL